jgi:muramoyltetrapeptide carboxypeptidase
MVKTLLRPPAIAPNARIHLVAPAGPVDPERLRRGLARLRHGRAFELVEASNLQLRVGYFAGDDETRLAALQRALDDPEAQVVWCARGGYGSTRLLSRLDPAGLRAHPKTIVGFSDTTALCAWAWSSGLPSLHGPVVSQLGDLHPEDVERVFACLRGELPSPLEAEAGTVVHGGRVEGWLCPANLEVMRSLLGTPFFPDLEGAILALEEVGERPYRIDRALTQLFEAGALGKVRGVVVGQLLGCREPEGGGSQGASAEEVVLERLERLGIPVVTGFAFGHDAVRNAALPFGTAACLDASAATLSFSEPLAVLP